MAVQNKQFKQISYFAVARDATGTFGSTTLTTAATAGAGTLTVAAITNFAVGDVIRVGSGEDTELAQVHTSTAPSGNTITLMNNLSKAHASGEPVVEQILYDMGDVSDAGIEFSVNAETSDVLVATKRLTYAVLNGYMDMSMGLTLPGVSLEAFAVAMGVPFTGITYANGATVPTDCLVEDGNGFNTAVNMSVIAIGSLNDGTAYRVELWGCNMDYTGISLSMSRGQAGGVPIRFMAGGGGLITTGTSTYTLNTTKKPSKGSVFDAVTEIGYFASGGTGNSTVSSGGTAGTNTVTLASGTGFAAGDWVKFGSGENAEYHLIDGVVTNTLTLRGSFLRSQAASTAAVEVIATPFAGLSVDGLTFSTSGTVTPIRVATQRRTAGLRSGNASVQLSFAITDFSLANWQIASASPSGALSGSRLTLADLMGTSPIDGVYFKGLRLDGKTFWVTAWGCSQDLSGLVSTLNNSGDAPTIPFTFKPASGFSLLVHA